MDESSTVFGVGSRPVFEGADFEQATTAVSGVINPHLAWIRSEDREHLDIRLFAAQQGPLTVSYLRYGTTVEIAAPDPASCYCIMVPLEGSSLIQCGRDQLRASASVASVPAPTQPLRMVWSADAQHMIVRVERKAVDDHLRALIHGPLTNALETELALDLDGPQGTRWRAVLDLVRADAAQQALDQSGLGTRTSSSVVNELVLNALLLWHPNNYSERLERKDRPARAPYVRQAIEYARAHLGDPITVSFLADQTGVSIRALQAGFARDVGCSPSEYVRDLRLDEVRRELSESEPGDVRVTDIALKWGFSHVGRFARTYHQRFGELPSVTVRSSSAFRR